MLFSYGRSLMRIGGTARGLSHMVERLLHRAGERGFPKIGFGPRAPDDHFGHVLHIPRNGDLLLVLVAQEGLLLELVEVIHIAIGIDYAPVRIWCVGHHKVIRKRQHALAVALAMRHEPLVSFRTLEL